MLEKEEEVGEAFGSPTMRREEEEEASEAE